MVDENLNRDFLNACKNGKLEDVKKAIENGADVNATDEHGMTALHWAATNGDQKMAELLLSKGAKLDIKDEFGYTPLQLIGKKVFDISFSYSNNPEKVKNLTKPYLDFAVSLIREGADPNLPLRKPMGFNKPVTFYSLLSDDQLKYVKRELTEENKESNLNEKPLAALKNGKIYETRELINKGVKLNDTTNLSNTDIEETIEVVATKTEQKQDKKLPRGYFAYNFAEADNRISKLNEYLNNKSRHYHYVYESKDGKKIDYLNTLNEKQKETLKELLSNEEGKNAIKSIFTLYGHGAVGHKKLTEYINYQSITNQPIDQSINYFLTKDDWAAKVISEIKKEDAEYLKTKYGLNVYHVDPNSFKSLFDSLKFTGFSLVDKKTPMIDLTKPVEESFSQEQKQPKKEESKKEEPKKQKKEVEEQITFRAAINPIFIDFNKLKDKIGSFEQDRKKVMGFNTRRGKNIDDKDELINDKHIKDFKVDSISREGDKVTLHGRFIRKRFGADMLARDTFGEITMSIDDARELLNSYNLPEEVASKLGIQQQDTVKN